MPTQSKKWMVKDTDGRILGPFSTQKILYMIGRGELSGEEMISLFPGSDWFLISQEPQFYDRLIEVLANSEWREAEENEGTQVTVTPKFVPSIHPSEPISADPVRGRVKRKSNLETEEPVALIPENEEVHEVPKERRKKGRLKEGVDSVIELSDLSQLVKKEKFKQVRMPLVLGISILILGLIFQFQFNQSESFERIHLLPLQKTGTVIDRNQLPQKIKEVQNTFSLGHYSSLIKTQNEIIHIMENDPQNSGMLALLCLTYFELWPYAFQDSKDLKTISTVHRRVSSIDSGGQNSATCQVVDLIVRGRYEEAKNMTETILETYGGMAVPPIPFYYFKAFLLNSNKESLTAINYLKSAQQLFPQWLSAYVLEADLQYKRGNAVEAAKIYQKILEHNPHHKVARIELGLIEMKNFNHLEKGMIMIKEALASNDLVPSSIFSKAYLGLAEGALSLRNNADALNYAQKSFYYNTNNVSAKNLIMALGGKEKLNNTVLSSQQMVFEGDQFVREGDCSSAQAHFKTAFELDKKNAMAAMKAAQCLWQLSFSREAIDWLNRAIRADSHLIDAYVLLADYFTQRYDFLSAARVLSLAQKESPKSYEVYRGYALVELRRGNPKGAIGYATKALSLYENDVETYILLTQSYLAKNDPTLALKYAAKAIEIDVNNRQAQVEYARALVGTKGIEMAIDYLSRLISTYPMVSEYRMAIGEIYLEDERYQESIDIFRQITEIEEKPKKAFFMLGKALRLSGRIPEALEALLKSAVLDPADTEPLFEAGLIYLEIGKPREAGIQFQRVLNINHNHPGAHYQKGLAALMENDPKKALEESEEERKINPNLADAYILAAEAYYRMNQHSLCASEYTKAIKLRPQGAETYLKVARCYRLMGNFDMAKNMLKTAGKYDAGLPDIYRELGETYLSEGDVVLAAETFNQYFQLNPAAPDRQMIEKRVEEVARSNQK